jgi:hypothetical protein
MSSPCTGSTAGGVTRVCTLAHNGSCSAELAKTKANADAILDDSPDTVSSTPAGATYGASAWARAPARRSVTLRVRELSGNSLVRSSVVTAAGTGGCRQLS